MTNMMNEDLAANGTLREKMLQAVKDIFISSTAVLECTDLPPAVRVEAAHRIRDSVEDLEMCGYKEAPHYHRRMEELMRQYNINI